jgi:hypothetical protein
MRRFGNFEFNKIPAGAYLPQASRAFATAQYGARELKLDERTAILQDLELYAIH